MPGVGHAGLQAGGGLASEGQKSARDKTRPRVPREARVQDKGWDNPTRTPHRAHWDRRPQLRGLYAQGAGLCFL